MMSHGGKKPKRKRGEKPTDAIDYMTGAFFVVLVVMIIYGMVNYIFGL